MVTTKLLVVASLSHDNGHSLFLEAVEVDTMSFLGFTFFIQLYAWSSKGDVGG
jgi:hypothetical protein